MSGLIRLKSGKLSYITKRIDRSNSGEKIYMLDMFRILEAVDKYKGSMERVGKAIGTYSDNTLLDKLYFFELSVFCFLTGNNDMHLKNFSLINKGESWGLSPAYDLLNVSTINPGDNEELALTLNSKKRRLKKEDFNQLGASFGLNEKQLQGVYKRFSRNKNVALNWNQNSFLSAGYQEKYMKLVEQRDTVFFQ